MNATDTTDARLARASHDLDQLRGTVREIRDHARTARDYTDSGPDHQHSPEHTPAQAAEADADRAREELARIAEIAARAAGGEYRPAYNGWTNRETWNAALWISNEPALHDAAREIVAEKLTAENAAAIVADFPVPIDTAEDLRRIALRDAADEMRSWFDGSFGPTRPGPVVDAWNYAVAVVDWYRIAEGYAEDIPTPWPVEPVAGDEDA